MKTILLGILAWDVVLGIAMYAYIWLQWHTEKRLIAAHGWDMELANPSEISDIWRWFVPIYGPVMFLVAGTLLQEMAFRSKLDCKGKIEVNVLGFSFIYQQPIA